MASGGVGVMDKPIQLQQQRQQQLQPPQSHEALKCPRCDSSNTKFCYYNNYSLSQPRHFCKACKRYWTRGGTLRNVPVGGGCRKNKRVKRPIINTTSTAVHHVAAPAPPPASNHQTNPNPNPNPNPDHNHQIPSSTTSNSNHHLNPLFYGLLPQNPNYNPRFDSSITSETTGLVSGYDLLQQPRIINAASSGLGFSGTLVANHGHNSNLTFSSYMNSSPMYAGGSTSSSTSAPTMASLLASSLSQQQRFMGFASYDVDGSMIKDLKIEEAVQNRMEWNNNNFQGQNNNKQQQMEAVDDPNSLLWDTDQGGVVWLNDPATNNINGSSVTSLI